MYARRVTLDNATGLHVRPATAFMELASRYRSAIRVANGDAVADGKSAIGLMLLEAGRGAALTLRETAMTRLRQWMPWSVSSNDNSPTLEFHDDRIPPGVHRFSARTQPTTCSSGVVRLTSHDHLAACNCARLPAT